MVLRNVVLASKRCCKAGCMTTYTKFIHLVEGSWLLGNAADVLSSPAIAWSNISASKHVSEKN